VKGTDAPRPQWLRRFAWLVALWLLGVAVLGAAALLLRWLMRLFGYSV
jgi:Protein of unknown function (DUF2474)